MNTAEIVVRQVQGNGGFQMRQFFAERIREPRKSAHRHTHREILSLDKAGRNLIGIGIALTDSGYNPRDAWLGVPRFGSVELPVVAKHLRELREVNVRPEASRAKIKEMQESLAVFEKARERGDPWYSAQVAQDADQNPTPCHVV